MSELRLDDLENGYRLWQDPSMFCFGIDAVLLAHYPELADDETAVDLGTGFAPIPHILCAEADKKGVHIHVTGIEIQHRAAELAKKSVAENSLGDRISIIEGDLREAGRLCGPSSATLVLSNPPYIRVGTGILSSNESRAIARTELLCTLSDVISQASRLLRMRGRFAMVHRPWRLPELFGELERCGLEPKRLRFVHPFAGAEASMLLLEAVKGGGKELHVEPPLTIYHSDHTYTEEVLRIYGRNIISGRHTDR